MFGKTVVRWMGHLPAAVAADDGWEVAIEKGESFSWIEQWKIKKCGRKEWRVNGLLVAGELWPFLRP